MNPRNYADPFQDTLTEGAGRIFNLKADRGRETPQQVSLSLITVDEQIQVRVDKLNHDRVETLQSVFENGGEMRDPVLVFNVDGEYLLIDGFHRVAAAVLAGLETIKAIVREGTYEEAVDAAEEANMFHGLPLTNSDRKELLRRREARGHRWATLTPEAVAKELGISGKTISRWRKEFTPPTGTNVPVARTGADGKVRDTTRIIEANKARVAPVETPQENDYPVDETPEFIRPHALGRQRFATTDETPPTIEAVFDYPVVNPVSNRPVQMTSGGDMEVGIKRKLETEGPILDLLTKWQSSRNVEACRALDAATCYELQNNLEELVYQGLQRWCQMYGWEQYRETGFLESLDELLKSYNVIEDDKS